MTDDMQNAGIPVDDASDDVQTEGIAEEEAVVGDVDPEEVSDEGSSEDEGSME